MNPVNYILLLAACVCGRCIITSRPDRQGTNSPLYMCRLNDITQHIRDCDCPRMMSLVTYKLVNSFNCDFKIDFFKRKHNIDNTSEQALNFIGPHFVLLSFYERRSFLLHEAKV